MDPDLQLPSLFELIARTQLVVRFLGERRTYVGRTETERKPFQYRVTLQYVERTKQNPYGLVVSAIEQNESLIESFPKPKSKN